MANVEHLIGLKNDGRPSASFDIARKGIVSVRPLVRATHWQWPLSPVNYAMALSDLGSRASDIRGIELARNVMAANKNHWKRIGWSFLAQGWMYDKIPNGQLGPELQIQGFVGRVGALFRQRSLRSSRVQQTERDQSVEKSDAEDSPIRNRGPLIPFLFGLVLLYGGAWLNYLNWRWLDDNRKRWRGYLGFVVTAALMGRGLVLMFFVASAYVVSGA
ncbi:hypothetical protein [Candidatus Binatus sp.]|uniref:hypothetical protein n=1 Tax=Candidatus Binatus sp. TaxID=2811406 RepID=UPI002F9411A3